MSLRRAVRPLTGALHSLVPAAGARRTAGAPGARRMLTLARRVAAPTPLRTNARLLPGPMSAVRQSRASKFAAATSPSVAKGLQQTQSCQACLSVGRLSLSPDLASSSMILALELIYAASEKKLINRTEDRGGTTPHHAAWRPSFHAPRLPGSDAVKRAHAKPMKIWAAFLLAAVLQKGSHAVAMQNQ